MLCIVRWNIINSKFQKSKQLFCENLVFDKSTQINCITSLQKYMYIYIYNYKHCLKKLVF